MRKGLVFKTISLTLGISCFFSLCLRDLSFAFTTSTPYGINLPNITSNQIHDSLGHLTQVKNAFSLVTVTSGGVYKGIPGTQEFRGHNT